MSAKAAKRERQRKQAGTVRAFREIPQDEMERAWRNATNPPIQVFQSPQFLASIYVDQGWLRLSVNRIRLAKGSDIHWDDGITWDELQQIKSLIPLDKLGRALAVGDFIVYGHALGRCAGIRIGRILKIKHEVDPYRTYHTPWRITVIGVDDDWSFEAPRLCQKKGTLMYPDRIVKITEADLPDKILALYR